VEGRVPNNCLCLPHGQHYPAVFISMRETHDVYMSGEILLKRSSGEFV